MLKTHEKSRFEVLNGTNVRDTKRIVVQIGEEKLYTNPAGMACFLCETVDPEDYNRATAEGRAAEAEKSLQEEIEARKIEMEEAEAKIAALEELLAEAKDAREDMRKGAAEAQKENRALYEALAECRRIFGELPPEIERLLNNEEGEKGNGYTCAI